MTISMASESECLSLKDGINNFILLVRPPILEINK